MFIRVSDSRLRSASKAISWRIVGSIDTFVITLLITGKVLAAGSIASLESISKVVLYYLHERFWSDVPLGRDEPPAPGADAQPAPVGPREDRDAGRRDGGRRADAAGQPSRPASAPCAAPVPHSFPTASSLGEPRC